MKNNTSQTTSNLFLMGICLLFSANMFAQQQAIPSSKSNDFWQNVQFGGGLGLSIGSGYTDISVSPSAIYNINRVVAVGTSLQFGYISSKNYYTSTVYGASLIGLVNPIPEIQLSAELEEVNVDTKYKNVAGNSENFWNTSLFLGAGYRTGNITMGLRYNVLFNENKNYYNDAFMPFVRVYF